MGSSILAAACFLLNHFYALANSWKNLVKNRDCKGGDCTANDQNRKELLDSLVDIRDVKIDSSQPLEERMRSYVEQIKNPYLFKVGNTIVRVSYANTQATINDNFVNLLASM